MVDFDVPFVADEHEPQGDFTPIPEGWYDAMIVGTEKKAASTGNGFYLKCEYDILGPAYAGRKVWQNLNLWNASDKAREIANGQLSAICKAIGLVSVKNSEELHARMMQIRVKIRPARDGYDAQNEVGGWRSVGGSDAPKAAPVAQAKAQPNGGGQSKAPWRS